MADNTNDLKVSIGKIETTIGHMEKCIERLERILDMVNTHNSRIDALENRVKTLEDGKSWVIKTVGAIIITALLGLVVVKTGIPLR